MEPTQEEIDARVALSGHVLTREQARSVLIEHARPQPAPAKAAPLIKKDK